MPQVGDEAFVRNLVALRFLDHLLEILRRIEGGTAALELADPAAPTVVRDMVDSSALYVLMPMRV